MGKKGKQGKKTEEKMEKGGAWDSEEIERKKGKKEREEEDAVNVMNSEKRRGGQIVDIIITEKRLVERTGKKQREMKWMGRKERVRGKAEWR